MGRTPFSALEWMLAVTLVIATVCALLQRDDGPNP